MGISNEQGLSRRRFLQGAGLCVASVAAVGMMAGCAAKNDGEALGDTGEAPRTYDPAETMDVDIVVVGSGASGVSSFGSGAAAVSVAHPARTPREATVAQAPAATNERRESCDGSCLIAYPLS